MIKKNKEFIVYKITHMKSNKSYIGITINYKQRMRSHFKRKDNTFLHRSIQKYGKDNFSHKIIFECNNWKELCKKEIEYIKKFNTKAPNGFNLTDGGEGLPNPSKETREKMRASQIGKKLSKEHREKISEGNKGQKRSLETRKKMSAWQIGRKFSDETRKKMSMMRQNISDETRKKLSMWQRHFSNNQILEIRKMLLDGISQYKIADKFDVAQGTVSRIKRNERYSDIQLPKGEEK